MNRDIVNTLSVTPETGVTIAMRKADSFLYSIVDPVPSQVKLESMVNDCTTEPVAVENTTTCLDV
jgi:tetrahydromethanopterin S-methyltransferase subunit B